MTDKWDVGEIWRKQLERRLFELSALVKGNLPTQADRIADVVEQIQALRLEVKSISERVDNWAKWAQKQNKPD